MHTKSNERASKADMSEIPSERSLDFGSTTDMYDDVE